MRLRSTQLVFLLLLACSPQLQAECASQLMAAAVSGRITSTGHQRETVSQSVINLHRLTLKVTEASKLSALDSASRAAHRVPWTMRRPALDSAAVNSFSGFLRA